MKKIIILVVLVLGGFILGHPEILPKYTFQTAEEKQNTKRKEELVQEILDIQKKIATLKEIQNIESMKVVERSDKEIALKVLKDSE